ncbi:MAG: CapA family protein [Oscillospiraceae bacterium]|nr:CapA family protein [Oscillospiraceae bacterium]
MEKPQRRPRKKKIPVRLIVAAAVLMLCGVLIFSISSKAPAPADPTVSTTAPTQGTTPATDATVATAETKPTNTVIHYAAAGDLNVNEKTVGTGDAAGYTDAFLDVAHLLAKADVASINFEGNLFGEPYGAGGSAPQALAEAMGSMGIDLVQMANSYSINKGISGLAASLNGITAAGMESVGAYATNKDFKAGKGYTIKNVQGIRIAFMAFTKGMDGMALPVGSENCVNVLYSDYDSAYQVVDTQKISSIINAAKKEKPDIMVALLHWGSEFNNTISPSQEAIAELLQANDVDAIIGTHSHYVQKVDFNRETGKVLAYSLGDFFSDASRSGSEYSIVLDLEITKDHKTGDAKITNCTYTPIFTVSEENKPLRVVRLKENMAAYESGYLDKVTAETYAKMQYALQRIEARVAGE